ncbi:MAG: dephospho-CoA kinase [Defluviitaleaceae bacterium]|nr:dephospho-CoA kinase [Defluviitaleaceae bacterium]
MIQNKNYYKQGKKVIGVTGSSGSGKSYVSKLFEKFGALIIDADKVGHSILENEAKEKILKEFGTVSRKELAAQVFSNKEKLNILNNIMHPLIIDKILNIIKTNNFVVIDAALLFETGLDKYCTETIYVFASYNTILERIIQRDGITREHAMARLKSQSKNIPNVNIIIYNEK